MPNRPRRLISEHGPLAYTDRPFDPKRACQQSCCRVAYLTAILDADADVLADRIGRRAVAEWDDPALGGPSVHLSPTGTSWYPHPLIYVGDETMSVEQAEVAARHLLAAVAMAREVTR